MTVTIIPQCEQWQQHQTACEDTLSKCLNHLEIVEEKDIAVVLTDDAHIQQLNRDFRNKDRPTNVLSFPSDAEDEWGDIILSYNTIAREAMAQNKPFDAHFTHLLVHGMLHLLGYDHMEEEDAEEMESLEIAILDQLAIANPYQKA